MLRPNGAIFFNNVYHVPAGGWPCVWNDDTPLMGSPCTNPLCGHNDRLYKLQLGMTAEFHGLLFWVVALIGAILLMEATEVWIPRREVVEAAKMTKEGTLAVRL